MLKIKDATPQQIADALSFDQLDELLHKSAMAATFCKATERESRIATLNKLKHAVSLKEQLQ